MSSSETEIIKANMQKLKVEMEKMKKAIDQNTTSNTTSSSITGLTTSSPITGLTAAQLSRIAENKKRALLLRAQRQNAVPATNSSRKKQKLTNSNSSSSTSNGSTCSTGSSSSDILSNTGTSEREPPKKFARIQMADEPKLSFLCSGLDSLLDGGLNKNDILEIHGPSASGKTQLVHQLLASVVVSNATDKCILLDTSTGFRPKRVIDICFGANTATALNEKEVSKQSLLDRIQYAAITQSVQLESLVQSIADRNDAFLPRLVVVDNVIKLFRSGKDRTKDNQSLSTVMKTLKILSQRGVVVVVVNEVSADFNAKMGAVKNFKPAGGQKITKHLTVRLALQLARNRAGYRKISRMESDGSVIEDFPFVITTDGICAHDE